MTYPDRVAAKAAEFKLTRVLLSILAAPFYVVGAVAAVLWMAGAWAISGVLIGFADVKGRTSGAD